MSSAAPTHRSISKSVLAKLLGCEEGDLLTRPQAAEIIGLGEGTLANLAQGGPAYYRSTTAATGGKAWYPRTEVEAFAMHIRATIKSTYNRTPRGEQDWTALQDANDRVPVHLAVAMINEWKEAELYRRAQSILDDPYPVSGREKFEEELRLFGAAEKEGRLEALALIATDEGAAARRKAIFESFDDQTNAIESHLLQLASSHGLAMTRRHPSFSVLTGMFGDAWQEVLEAERRWRNLDYTGMPSRRPQTVSQISISVAPKDRPAARAGS